MAHVAQIGAVYVVDFTFTATLDTVTIHKFQNRCAVQLGDPDNNLRGIVFEGNVHLEIDPKVKAPHLTGNLEIIQNTNFSWKRTPPLHPNPKSKLHSECRSSKGQWYFDDSKSVTAKLGSKVGHKGQPDIMFVDSPGVWLEENQLAFEHVDMNDQFMTYLCWNAAGHRVILARIDWRCKGSVIHFGGQQNDCNKQWGMAPNSNGQAQDPLITGAQASHPPPVLTPNANKDTKWELC